MKLRNLLIGLFAFTAIVSCKEEPLIEKPVLEVSETMIGLAAESAEGEFTIMSNNPWTAKSNATWITVSPSSGEASEDAYQVSISAEDNDTDGPREATVTITSSTLTHTITVVQAAPAPDPVLELSVSSLELGGVASQESFEINANYAWALSCDAEWLSFDTTEGEGSDEGVTVTLYAGENTTGEPRETKFVVTSGELTKEVTVTQAIPEPDEPSLVVSAADLTFETPEAAELSFTVTSNNPWSIACEEDWIAFTPAEGVASEEAVEVKVSVLKNEIDRARSATLTVTSGELTQTVTVVQAAGEPIPDPILEVNVESVAFESVASEQTFTVTANNAWAVSSEAEWLSFNPAEGVASEDPVSVTVAALENTSLEGRVAVITVTSGELAVSITASQAAKVPAEDIVDGAGTETDPYLINSVKDFNSIRTLAVEGGETWFKMVDNIDLAEVTDFEPFNHDNSFTRKIHFDGGNYTISNLNCDNSTYGGNYPSLFGVLYGSCKNLTIANATIKGSGPAGVIAGYAGTTGKEALVENVTITNATHTNTSNRAGGVCGVAKEATFKNVSFQGSVTTTITTSEAKSGGFVGETETSATFENCSTDVTVKGAHSDLGGFAGKTSGVATFTGCTVKVALESSAERANRAGGFIGWSSATTTTITNCHVLSGSTVKETSARTESEDSYIGGFIGFGDRASAVVKIKGCSSKANVTVGDLAPRVSAFIGNLGYASTVTIEDSYAEGTVTSAKNYVGGLVGIVYPCCNLTITGCHFSGTISANSGVGGLVGGYDYGSDKSGKLVITKSYSTGSIKGANNVGGIVGLTTGEVLVENCWSSANLSSSGQFGGGIVGGSQLTLTVKNCYTSGKNEVSRGSGGIAGQVKGTSVVIEGCVAWGTIKSNRSVSQYSCGAIVGNTQIDGTFKTSYRKADMSFTDVAMTLVDHDDCTGSRPPLPTYEGTTADKNQYAYHGKAAAADATISSVASSIGWDTTVWDLSGVVPTLK